MANISINPDVLNQMLTLAQANLGGKTVPKSAAIVTASAPSYEAFEAK